MDDPIEVIEITYGRTVNVGNYENVRIDFKARVRENQTPDYVYKALKKLCDEKEKEIRLQYRC